MILNKIRISLEHGMNKNNSVKDPMIAPRAILFKETFLFKVKFTVNSKRKSIEKFNNAIKSR